MKAIDHFERGWQLDPQALCLVDGSTGQTMTYDEVRAVTLRVAHRLKASGWTVGHKAAVLSYNDPQGYSVVLSLLRAGVTWLPINPRNALVDNAEMMARLDCQVLFFQSAFADDVAQIRRIAPNIKEYICIDAPAAGCPSLAQWLGDTAAAPFDSPEGPDLVFAIQSTGGTTGLPKGVMMSNRNLACIVESFLELAPFEGRPVYLAVAPLTHAGGMVLQHLLVRGGKALVFSKADKVAMLDAFERHHVTHTFLPPTVIYELLAQPTARGRDYSALRYFFYGASPMAPDKLREALAVFGPVMAQIYGQTESGVPNTFLSPQDHFENGQPGSNERLSSAGRANPRYRIEIMDEEGALLPDGQVGEIVVQGDGVMLGYYGDDAATAQTRRDGWHCTGDVAYRDAEGFFHIVDRLKDMIISGGFNIYSSEVERALLSHPSVQDCAVFGAPDPKWGEAVTAVVQLKPGHQVDADTLIAFSKAQIGSMKSPKRIDFMDELPRSAVGKVLKRELKKPYWGEHTRLVS